MLMDMWEETGIKPSTLVNRPVLANRWEIPHVVWLELSGSRNYTAAGAAEIPFSEFYFWANAHSYTKAELVSMWEDVHTVDKVWLSESNRYAEAKRNTESQPAKK